MIEFRDTNNQEIIFNETDSLNSMQLPEIPGEAAGTSRLKRSRREQRELLEKIAIISDVFDGKDGLELLPSPDDKWRCGGLKPATVKAVNEYLKGQRKSIDDLSAEDFKPSTLYYSISDIERCPLDSVLGYARQQARHAIDTNLKYFFQGQRAALDQESSPRAFLLLYQAFQNNWIDKREIDGSSVVREQMQARFEDSMKGAEKRVAEQPLLYQLALNINYYWYTGSSLPGIRDKQVLSAFEAIKNSIDVFTESDDQKKNYQLFMKEVWPHAIALQEAELKMEVLKHLAREATGFGKDDSNKRGFWKRVGSFLFGWMFRKDDEEQEPKQKPVSKTNFEKLTEQKLEKDVKARLAKELEQKIVQQAPPDLVPQTPNVQKPNTATTKKADKAAPAPIEPSSKEDKNEDEKNDSKPEQKDNKTPPTTRNKPTVELVAPDQPTIELTLPERAIIQIVEEESEVKIEPAKDESDKTNAKSSDKFVNDLSLDYLSEQSISALSTLRNSLSAEEQKNLEAEAKNNLRIRESVVLEETLPQVVANTSRKPAEDENYQSVFAIETEPETKARESIREALQSTREAIKEIRQIEYEAARLEEQRQKAAQLRQQIERAKEVEMQEYGFSPKERRLYDEFKELENPMLPLVQQFNEEFQDYMPRDEAFEWVGGYARGSGVERRSMIRNIVNRSMKLRARPHVVEATSLEGRGKLILDNTGSMQGEKIRSSIKTLIFFARVHQLFNLPFSIDLCGEYVTPIKDFTQDYDASHLRIKPDLLRKADAHERLTDLGTPLELAYQQLLELDQQEGEQFGVIYLISDGIANSGLYGDELRELANHIKQRYVLVNFLLSGDQSEIAEARRIFGEENVIAPPNFSELPEYALNSLKQIYQENLSSRSD